MFKNVTKGIGQLVREDAQSKGQAASSVLKKFGFERTGEFVEEELVAAGEGSAAKVEQAGKAVDGGVKLVTGFLAKDAAQTAEGKAELIGVAEEATLEVAGDVADKLENSGKVIYGLATGDTAQTKDGVTGLLGLGKVSVAIKVRDDLKRS